MILGRTALLFVNFAAFSTQDSIPYSASLIQYLAEQHPGICDCWFLWLSNEAEQCDALNELIQSHEIAVIPKRLITTTKPRLIFKRHPELLLIFGSYHMAALRQLFSFVFFPDFKESLKIIVFHQSLKKDEIFQINQVFAQAKLFNVIYIRTDRLEVHYEFIYRAALQKWRGPVGFDELFVDQTSNLEGHSVRVSYPLVSIDVIVSKRKNSINGRVLEWVLRTIQHINGTFVMYSVECYEDEPEDVCYRKQHLFNARTPYDFVLEELSLEAVDTQFISSVTPVQLLIAAPRGRQLTIYETFIIPFDKHTWIIVITFVIVCSLLMLIFPNLFQNDLILMPICGFERKSLNHVSRIEKFIFLPLIVITFILSSAYESKLIAFMTSYPHAPNPRSFEDLLQAGITVYAESNNSYGVASDPRFAQVIKYDPSSEFDTIDPNNKFVGYCGKSHEIRFLVEHPKSYNVKLKLSRLVVLDQFSMGTVIPFYFVGRRNPLRDRFRETESNFFETGLMEFWARHFLHRSFGTYHEVRIADTEGSTGNILGLEKLGPVCVVLMVGCGLASVVFFVELAWFAMKKNLYGIYRQLRNVFKIR